MASLVERLRNAEHLNAFPGPVAITPGGDVYPAYPGMTLRDWFAGQALVGVGQEYLHRNGFHGDTLFGNLAAHAYCIADAMLAQRERGQ